MTSVKGKRRWIPVDRRLAIDIAIAAQSVPSFPVVRSMDLGKLEAFRRTSTPRIGWAALLTRAYSKVCNEVPELRDVYVRWPSPYLYRHPEPVASITIHRVVDTHRTGNALGKRLIWGRLASPHLPSLAEIQCRIEHFASAPIEEVFADGLRMERRAAPWRALTWWILTRWSGRKRAKHVGTFSISSLGGWGALNAHHPLITTTSLAMGPLNDSGCCDVVLICDHRVIDGALAATALSRLEQVLQKESLVALVESNTHASAA